MDSSHVPTPHVSGRQFSTGLTHSNTTRNAPIPSMYIPIHNIHPTVAVALSSAVLLSMLISSPSYGSHDI